MAADEARIGIALIGGGAVADLHAAAVARCTSARLLGVYEPDPERAEEFGERHDCRAYPSREAVLGDDDVTAVLVLSPVEHHVADACAALTAGRHVLVEKPVATSSVELRRLVEVADRSGRVCMPAHNYIYTPELRRAHRLIRLGSVGQVTAAWITYTIQHPVDIARKYPGILRQIVTHHFYTLIFLLGSPRRIVALASETRRGTGRLDREDQAALLLELPDGTLVSLFAGFAADDQTSHPWTVAVKVLGTQGGVSSNWRDAVRISPGGGLAWRYPVYEESFEAELDWFVEHCIARSELPLSTLDDALTAQLLVEAAEESVRTGRVIDL